MAKPTVSVEIHPGRHLVDAFRIFGAHPLTLVEIAAFGVIPTTGYYLIPGTWTGTIVFQIPFMVAQQVVYGALVYAAASFTGMTAILGTDALEAYRAALGKLRDLVEALARQLGAALLLAITVVGIPWAIRLVVRWNFAVYAIILDDLNAKGAISFSCDLVTGRWWQIAGLLVAAVAPAVGISLLVLLLKQSTLPSLIFSVAYVLVATPLFAAFWTRLFLELRAAHPDYQAEAMSAT